MQILDYELIFKDGGLLIEKDGKTLYFNRRPVFVTVKNEAAMLVFRDCPYETVEETEEGVCAKGTFVTDNGSVLSFSDRYEDAGGKIKISRTVTVEKADPRDLGFSTKIFFYQALSQELTDFDYFSFHRMIPPTMHVTSALNSYPLNLNLYNARIQGGISRPGSSL